MITSTEVNITFSGWQILMLTSKQCIKCIIGVKSLSADVFNKIFCETISWILDTYSISDLSDDSGILSNSLSSYTGFFNVIMKWATPSEFVSSSIPSWQILTAHAQPFRGARDLAFCPKVPLDSLLVWASSGGSGETARMRRLAWTFAARIGDKYQIRLTRSKWYLWHLSYCSIWDLKNLVRQNVFFRKSKNCR